MRSFVTSSSRLRSMSCTRCARQKLPRYSLHSTQARLVFRVAHGGSSCFCLCSPADHFGADDTHANVQLFADALKLSHQPVDTAVVLRLNLQPFHGFGLSHRLLSLRKHRESFLRLRVPQRPSVAEQAQSERPAPTRLASRRRKLLLHTLDVLLDGGELGLKRRAQRIRLFRLGAPQT